MFLALGIAYFLPWYNSNLALMSIFIVSIFTVVSLINSAIMALMQSYMKVEFSLFSTIFWKIVNVSLVCVFVFWLFPREDNQVFFTPFTMIIIAWLVWIVINTGLNYLYARRICSLKFKFDTDYIKHIFKISLPYGLALFLSVVYFKVDIVLLWIMEGTKELDKSLLWVIEWDNKADVSIALYSLPMKIVEVLMVVGGFYLNSIMPSLTKLYRDWKESKLINMLSVSLKLLFSFWMLIFTMWVLFKDYVIKIIAHEKYLSPLLEYNSSDVFNIVLLVLVFHFISLVFIYSLITIKKQSLLLKINVFIALFNVVWNIIMIPKYSFYWAGIVTVISQILLMVLWYIYVRKYINIRLPFVFLFKIILLWGFVYSLWRFLLDKYSFLDKFRFWVYIDVFLYWTVLSLIYISIVYLINPIKNEEK